MERPIRLTKNKAVIEFGIDAKTLTKRLRQYDVQAGKDHKFSILQICTAIYGDIDNEKLRLVREQADGQALKNAEARRELVSATEVKRSIGAPLAAMTQAVQAAANLEAEDKTKLINHLRNCAQAALELNGGDNTASTKLQSQPVG